MRFVRIDLFYHVTIILRNIYAVFYRLDSPKNRQKDRRFTYIVDNQFKNCFLVNPIPLRPCNDHNRAIIWECVRSAFLFVGLS